MIISQIRKPDRTSLGGDLKVAPRATLKNFSRFWPTMTAPNYRRDPRRGLRSLIFGPRNREALYASRRAAHTDIGSTSEQRFTLQPRRTGAPRASTSLGQNRRVSPSRRCDRRVPVSYRQDDTKRARKTVWRHSRPAARVRPRKNA